VVQRGLDRGVPPAAIRDAANLLQRYELMYWDALEAATS
jgi:predicted nucleic acid-binding protein